MIHYVKINIFDLFVTLFIIDSLSTSLFSTFMSITNFSDLNYFIITSVHLTKGDNNNYSNTTSNVKTENIY